MINIIIADDHKIFIEGIRTTLSDVDDIYIAGQALNGAELLVRLENIEADVVLLDINMPGIDGLQAAEAIKKNFKDVKIIMLTQYDEKRFMKKCREIGVEGYLLKTCDKNELVNTIINVHNGGSFYTGVNGKTTGYPVPDLLNCVRITGKEEEVLQLIADEKCNDEIAKELNIEKTTVKTHKRRMLWKTGAKTITGLVVWAFRKRIIK
jgi:DNA-binding NarL/FixJ family response regulator